MKRNHLLLILLAFYSRVSAQDNLIYSLESQAIITTNESVPFWFRSNQNGSIPAQGYSSSMIGKVMKNFDNPNKKLDWAGGLNLRGNIAEKSELTLIEAYGKLKYGVFQLKAGRLKDSIGLGGDMALTSGNFSMSGNALGIPKIEISIQDYYTVPILNKLLSFKGSFTHGWMGRVPVADTIYGSIQTGAILPKNKRPNTFLHQKSFYGRIGQPDWKFKIHGGFNHQVVWGNERQIYGERFGLSGMETIFYVTTGKAYGNISENGIPRSKIGNHLGSIDIGLEYDFNNIRIFAYRQSFYDVGALSKLANIKDGLNGIQLVNKNVDEQKILKWKKFLIEFLYTKDQAGLTTSKITKSGDEDYYNNFFYTQGWSYKGQQIGSPFLTTNNQAKSGQVSDPRQFFINNRVIAFHVASEFRFGRWDNVLKLSQSKNWGTFKTSPEGSSLGETRSPPKYGIFTPVNQFSFFLSSETELRGGYRFGYQVALDQGELLNNSFGLALKASKSF